jgi:hypothetical protein
MYKIPKPFFLIMFVCPSPGISVLHANIVVNPLHVYIASRGTRSWPNLVTKSGVVICVSHHLITVNANHPARHRQTEQHQQQHHQHHHRHQEEDVAAPATSASVAG